MVYRGYWGNVCFIIVWDWVIITQISNAFMMPCYLFSHSYYVGIAYIWNWQIISCLLLIYRLINIKNSLGVIWLPFIVITLYGVVRVQLAHFSLGDRKDISIAHVIIIAKSEVSILPIVCIFSVVVCLRCLLHHLLSLISYTFRKIGIFGFIIIVQFMKRANYRICFGLKSYSFFCTLHNFIIIIVQTYLKA